MSELGDQRHRARERALEVAYEASIKERSIDSVVGELPLAPDPYSIALLASLDEHREWARELIIEHSMDWQFERMPLVDRLVMPLALCEARMADAPPKAVLLDEAVELAKTYSTDGSPGFVNGVVSSCLAAWYEQA